MFSHQRFHTLWYRIIIISTVTVVMITIYLKGKKWLEYAKSYP
jgi:hypothetical protein